MKVIDKEQLLLAMKEDEQAVGFGKYQDEGLFWETIENQPTIEAEEVRHGQWLVTNAYPHRVYCSQCFRTFANEHWEIWQDGSLPRRYCPNCGSLNGEE